MAQLKVTQVRSDIGAKKNQRESLRSLGLKRINDVVVKEDRPEIQGNDLRGQPPREGRGG